MITLQKLQLFVAAVEQGSFNAAAQTFRLSQSAVSEHIHDLEKTLGTPLFERHPTGSQPTAAGVMLYDYAGRILALVAEAEREVRAAGAENTGAVLRVGVTPGISVYLLPAWLQQFQRSHADTPVSLQTALTAEVVREVLKGTYDLGFLEGDLKDELADLDDDALGRAHLRGIDYVVAVSPAHPWAGRDRVSVSELAKQPFINRQPESRARRWLESTLAHSKVRLRSIAELDSPGAIKYALLNNMGVAILPLYAVEREAERGDLRLLRLMDAADQPIPLARPLLLVWNRRTPFNPLQRAFIGMLAAEMPDLATVL